MAGSTRRGGLIVWASFILCGDLLQAEPEPETLPSVSEEFLEFLDEWQDVEEMLLLMETESEVEGAENE